MVTGRESSVGIEKSYEMDDRISIPGKGKRFSVLNNIQTYSEAHSASYPKDTVFFLGLKRQGLEADHFI
jgi:hypothetical protein